MKAIINKYRFSFLSYMFFLCSVNSPAQSNADVALNDSVIDIIDSLKDVTPTIELSSDYANKVVFWGRDFGRSQYGFENNVIFKTGKGLYFDYTGYVWSASPNTYAKTDLGIGYERQITDRLYVSAGYERWFFNTSDDYLKKALANFMEADINYDFGLINIEPDLYYMFGLEHIFQTDINVNGEFYICSVFKSGALSLKPQWLTTFANQAFLPIYAEYPVGYVNEKRFKLVDFELSLPVSLKIRNFQIEPNFHYNIPVKINNEQIHSFFYFSLHVAYNFYFDKGRIKKLYKSLK